MSKPRPPKLTMHGTIRRRLLVNAVVDPDEAARHLPDGLRPHLIGVGTVVGCCLLEIEALRPSGMPVIVGQRIRATAHRIAAEWGDEAGATVTGVYVPVRHTDSRLASLVGGRIFPGVHERARIEISTADSALRWRSDPFDDPALAMQVVVSVAPDGVVEAPCEPVGATCLDAAIGVSPDHRGVLEAAHMAPAHRVARRVVIEDLRSGYIDSFASAELTNSYLMSDVDVTWTRTSAPAARARAAA